MASFQTKFDESRRSAAKLLEKSRDFYETTINLSNADDKIPSFLSPDEFKNEKYKKIIELSCMRDQKIKKAKMVKQNIEIETKKRIHDDINKKSKEYKEALAQIRSKKLEFNKKLKRLLLVLNIEVILRFLNVLSTEGNKLCEIMVIIKL